MLETIKAKNYRLNIFSLFFLIFLSSCYHLKEFNKKQNAISQGQTKAEVIKIMGDPKDKQFKDTDEAWQYYVKTPYCKYTIVWFNNGIVTGLSSYVCSDCSAADNCQSSLRQINWRDKPDKTIEIIHSN